MKNTKLNKRKNVFAMFALMLMFAMTITSVLPATIIPAYADTDGTAQTPEAPTTNGTEGTNSGANIGVNAGNDIGAPSGDYSMTNLADKAETTLEGWKGNIVRICFAVFPIALIVCLAVLFFTHDERKIATTVKVCVTICIVALIILLVERNVVEEIIRNLANEI